jgi:hypothetical protein
MRTFRVLLAILAVAVCGTVASAQNAGAPPSIQPVPGAMPNTDDVPSALSPKNAQDDALPVAAYRLKHLTDAQRQTIYRALMPNQNAAKPANASTQHVDIGMALPPDATLQPVPADLARNAPGLDGLQYHIVGDQLVLVEPIYRQVLAVIAP